MNDRDTNNELSASHHGYAETAALVAADGGHTGLWAYLAEVRVIANGGCRAETRIVRGLFCAKNHHEARARASTLAAAKARELGHVIDISLSRLW
ncbi:MAG: hypothetical protein RLY21_2413 [Planctomycetota bacterium]|jgi:hypothetical protein